MHLLETVYFQFRALIKLTKKCRPTFQTLKETLYTASILAYPQPKERVIVDTDVSNIGICGALSQVQDRQERVTAYYSTMLNKAERNYCVPRWELLAIVRTLEHFHKYLYGQ
jgi:hypothetical protein